jgi:hypothetical protein
MTEWVNPSSHALARVVAAPPATINVLRRGPYGLMDASDPANANYAMFNDTSASENGWVPMSGIQVRRGLWTNALMFKFGSTWTPMRGGPGGTLQPALEFSGTSEYITEVYVHTAPWYTSNTLNGLLFRTNLGREAGWADLTKPELIRAFPCPIGQYRLAYVDGMAAPNTGNYVHDIQLYW